MRLFSTVIFLILLAQAIGLPLLSLRSSPKRLYADIDPQKAPETARNIRDYVARYGPGGMTVRVGDLNDREAAGRLRAEATSGYPQQHERWVVDEEPPASFRRPGDHYTLRETPRYESRYKCFIIFISFIPI